IDEMNVTTGSGQQAKFAADGLLNAVGKRIVETTRRCQPAICARKVGGDRSKAASAHRVLAREWILGWRPKDSLPAADNGAALHRRGKGNTRGDPGVRGISLMCGAATHAGIQQTANELSAVR